MQVIPKKINPWRRLKHQIKKRLGWTGVPKLVLYRGYASADKIHLTGFLTEDKGLEKTSERNSTCQNLVAMAKRYSSDNYPGISISVKVDKQLFQTKTKADGTFTLQREHHATFSQQQTEWRAYSAQVNPVLAEPNQNFHAEGEFMLPAQSSGYGVISDIDDTIIVSHSTRMIRKLWLLLFRNSKTRKPFPGVDSFYQALEQGTDRHFNHPFFYVSSSEWNLYDLLEDFCTYNKLPKGVFLLQELKEGLLQFKKSGGGNHEHKYHKIKHLLTTYPALQFVLIGDNGQRDPEIYYRIASEFPGRIKAIYIRTVRKKEKPSHTQLRQLDLPVVFTNDSTEAAMHAAQIGLIDPSWIPRIEQDAEKDREFEVSKKVFLKD